MRENTNFESYNRIIASKNFNHDNSNKFSQDFDSRNKISQEKSPNDTYLYIAEIDNDCELPFETKHFGKNIIAFYSNFSQIHTENILKNNKCVKEFQHLSKPLLHSRYLRTAILSDEIDMLRNKDYPFSAFSIYNELGLNGNGQLAAIADTGLDMNSCWFRDKAEIPYDSFSNTHRKIAAYLPYSDDDDLTDGHGTIVAGIVAGKASCKNKQKKICGGTFYDGVAPEARLVIQDVINNEGNLDFPSNISELFEIPHMAGCVAQLNAWSYEQSKLITRAIDQLAFDNPNMTIVFASGDGEEIRSPADSKNVLAVGALSFPSYLEHQESKNSTVKIVIDGKKVVYGYCDLNAGIPFLEALAYSGLSNDVCTKGILIGVSPGDGFIDEFGEGNLEDLTNAGIVLAFHSKTYNRKRLRASVIRLKAQDRQKFRLSSRIVITPEFNLTRETKVVSANGPVNYYRRKPDVIMPGGPAYAPRAHPTGERVCASDGLIVAEGSSVAAAFAVGNILILSQWLREGWYPLGSPNPDNSIEPCSTLIRAILVNTAEFPENVTEKEGGYGMPHLNRFMQINSSDTGTKIYPNMTISPEKSHKYTFMPQKDGLFRATLCWMDPLSDYHRNTDISHFLDIRVFRGNDFVIGNRKLNQDYSDVHSTIKRVEINVTEGEIIEIYIILKKEYDDDSVQYSLVMSGPFNMFDENSTAFTMAEVNNAPCLRKCPDNEACFNGFCKCQKINKCHINADRIHEGQVHVKEISSYDLHYLCIDIPTLKSNSIITVNLSTKNNKKFDYFYRANKLPTFSDADCTSMKCDFGDVTQNSFTLNSANWDFLRKGDKILIGYYLTEQGEDEITISATYS